MKTSGAISLVLAAGCGVQDEIDTTQDALATAGVLAFVNSAEATFELLDEDVGLDTRAARNIANRVRGRDRRYGTSDDRPFGGIAELDAVAYVGQKAFEKLDAWVRANGPTPDVEVEGVVLTAAQATAILGVANRATFDVLDRDVGLDSRAASGIVEARPIADLVELASVSYVGRGAIELLRDYASVPAGASITIASDASWSVLGADPDSTPGDDWMTTDFDDARWPTAEAPAPTNCGAEWVPAQPWEGAATSMWSTDDRYAAFFRKTFVVPRGAAVTRAVMTVEADDDIAVYVDGVEVYVEPDFLVVDENRIIRHTVDLTGHIAEGSNVIALHAVDTVGGCRWAFASGKIFYTP